MAFINTELASFDLSLDLILRIGVFGCFFGCVYDMPRALCLVTALLPRLLLG